jgi:hypothetical protein
MFTWTDDATEAFTHIKMMLASATLLVHPTLEAPTALVTDASEIAVGAVLQQHVDGQWCPLALLLESFEAS